MLEWAKELWPFVEHAGGASALIVALLAAAYFSPVFKVDFVWAAVAVAILLFSYSVGVRDEHRKWDARAAAITKQVHDAVVKAHKTGTKDPYDDKRH